MGQTAFAMTRSTILRAAIGAAFAVPAAIAGYHVVLAMSQIGVPSLAWREVFACLGAVSVGATAWMRLTLSPRSRPLVPSGAVGSGPQASSHGRHAAADNPSPTFVVEQVRADRRIEEGIVELEREGARLLWRASTSRPDLGSAHTDSMVRRSVRGVCRLTMPPFPHIVSFSTLNRSHLLFATTEIRQSSPDIMVQHADARGLFDGLIWPKTGYASIV